MTLMGHLNELRRRLFRIVIIVLLGFVAFYGVAEYLYAYLSAPLQAQLPAGSKLIYTSPAGAFFTYMKVALVASLFGTSPISFYQVWAFIAPGLYKEEKRAVLPLAFFSSIFFVAGAAFCFFTVFPIAFKFFMGFATDTIVPMISVEEYLGFALKLLIAFGVVFEMPLFAYFLSRFGILSPDFMRRQRRYAILLIFIVAAILTPPDVFSQCLMALPMFLLYEVSIYVSAMAYKKKEDKSEEPEEESEENTEEQA
ncbi:MAG: twin-arginine translocase subunit TatC [Mailhella sp.]|nr:twin-arginine translocase subunit TatC [Mailhella sp.]